MRLMKKLDWGFIMGYTDSNFQSSLFVNEIFILIWKKYDQCFVSKGWLMIISDLCWDMLSNILTEFQPKRFTNVDFFLYFLIGCHIKTELQMRLINELDRKFRWAIYMYTLYIHFILHYPSYISSAILEQNHGWSWSIKWIKIFVCTIFI